MTAGDSGSPAAMTDEQMQEAFLEKFKRSKDQSRPEWALHPDAAGSISQAMDSVPLFMTSAPESLDDNPTLQALQALLYDGTPDEVAENFKNQGNEAFKEKRWKDAYQFYTRGIEQKPNDKLLSTLYNNRSAVCLQEGTSITSAYGDAKRALKADPENIKAVSRATRCAIKLHDLAFLNEWKDKLEDSELRKEVSECVILLEKEEQRRKEQKGLEESLQKRFKISFEPGCEAQTIGLFGPGIDSSVLPQVCISKKTSYWPILMFYPHHGESDLLQACSEDGSLLDHLMTVFEVPAPWDTAREYTAKSVDLFIISTRDPECLFSINPRRRVRDLFPEVIDRYDRGIIGLYVIPKAHSKSFTGRFNKCVQF